MSSIVAMFLFLSLCLFTAHSAINRSHSAEAFLSACVGLWQQLPLDGGERMACQGQNCTLINVHQRAARLTPVPFTPEAFWHYVCACYVSYHAFALSLRLQQPDTEHINSVTLLIASDGTVIYCWQKEEKRREKKDGGVK